MASGEEAEKCNLMGLLNNQHPGEGGSVVQEFELAFEITGYDPAFRVVAIQTYPSCTPFLSGAWERLASVL